MTLNNTNPNAQQLQEAESAGNSIEKSENQLNAEHETENDSESIQIAERQGSHDAELLAASVTEKPVGKHRDQVEDLKIMADDIVKKQDLNEIGNFILEGYGELLLGAKSENEQIQEFINHLPIYLVSCNSGRFCFSM